MKSSHLIALSILLSSLSLLNPPEIKAQETQEAQERASKKYTHTIGLNGFKGLIIKHRQGFGHLSASYPSGFEVFINRNSYGHKLWEQLYNYPDFGFSLAYYDYHNPMLGMSVSAITYLDFYLLRAPKSSLIFKVGGGLAYTSNPYDREKNPGNIALRTYISFALQGRLGYHFALSDQSSLQASLTLTHFSNGAIRQPNSGINIVTPNVGFAHRLQDSRPGYQRRGEPKGEPAALPLLADGIRLNLQLASGVQGLGIRPGTSFPFLNLSVYADYRISRVSALNMGLDGFYSTATRERMIHEMEDGELPDYKRAGLTLGHELFFHKASILVQLGAYIYAPYEPPRSFYQRYGFKYYFHEKIYSAISFKAHLGRAENLEFSLGLRL